ncbi:MAG: adenylate/guanylate cyclase domain-containing protein, partial [Acidimicrobiia bacterium]|nr:adenylate/guanylate cyclase domain-containing protein [Acidimicrobiia bacterium]
MDLPSGFVTFLFTDIEGSSRLFRRVGDRYIGLLERHHELLRSAWTQHDGAEVKTEGDAFFVAFADASEAVRAAMAAQQAIGGEPWPDDVVLRVRIGIHSGLASPRDGDYIAFAVHQAARVVGAAHGGQILLSDETRRAVGGAVPELYSVGRYRIRDFDDPIELFQADPIGVPKISLLPRATPAMGHNLTQPDTSFVGRHEDLAELGALLKPGAVVSIVGPGGAGKTRLATELGLHVVGSWPDGVWMVELAALVNEAPLAGTVATSLGLSLAGRDPLEAIVADLAGDSAVIILDNCEHLVEATADLAAFVRRRVPSLALLTTSREPLGISGERLWRIQPASTPDAVELFIDRALSGGLRTPGTPEELSTIERICRRLDGNPLAIELAAARSGSTGVAGLESALDDRFRILSSRSRDVDPRQRSLTALLDWSYDLLLPSERLVLRRLSLFQDTFSLDGSERAAVDGSLDSDVAMDAVWALVDKSLLVVDATDNETRYKMAETVRQYAARHLEDGEGTATAGRLGEWYLARFGPWVVFDPGRVSSARVELDNIRGVVGALADADQQAAQLLAVSIAYLRDVSGEVVEGIAELEGFLHRLTQPTVARAI